jgi:oligopeptide/dipeptide ABC transporter ATP-binding protein
VLLEAEELTVRLSQGSRLVTIVSGLNLQIGAGEAVGLIGESGSGKSVTARSLIRLLPPTAEISGQIRFGDVSVLDMDRRELAAYRARDVGFVFQDPTAHINPVRTIGDFMTEAVLATERMSREGALRRAADSLAEVGISEPGRRLEQYPHQLSGGMLQRVMIATALMQSPRLIIADEPTTALDLITQSEIIAILQDARETHGTSVLFISHDLELAAATCDRTAVMYAGTIVEEGPSNSLESFPSHPYTAGLVASRPSLGPVVGELPTIPGRSVAAFEAPRACVFSTRCPHAQDICRATRPLLGPFRHGSVACHRAAELAGTLVQSGMADDE